MFWRWLINNSYNNESFKDLIWFSIGSKTGEIMDIFTLIDLQLVHPIIYIGRAGPLQFGKR
jgi:hypothetical protein